MPEEPYRTREHDHLVEPFFAGLEPQRIESGGPVSERTNVAHDQPRRRLVTRILGWFRFKPAAERLLDR